LIRPKRKINEDTKMDTNNNRPISTGASARPDCPDQKTVHAGHVRLNNDGSVTMPMMEEGTDWMLDIANQCSAKVAAMVERIRCLRAARGGVSNTSQTAGKFLANPRIKSVTLKNSHRSILKKVADTEEELQPMLVATISKTLELELYKADLQRFEDAIEGKRLEDADQELIKIWPEARAVVTRLAWMGVLEGHWSTVSLTTLDKIKALIFADNAAAGAGSPDDPRIAGERSRKSR
jgi:hypothetical protein